MTSADMKNIIIFDYDGVLVDSLDIFMDQFLEACQLEGWNQINSKESFLSLFHGNMYENMMKIGMSKQDILKVVLRVKKGLLTHEKKMKLFPKIKETLEIISKNNILLISTSNDSTVVRRFLTLQHISCFKEVYGSDKHHSKVEKMSMIKNKYPDSNYYYVGDTIGDIEEGKKAHIKTIAVTWGWHNKQQLEMKQPDFIVDTPTDLITLFQ